MSDDDVDLPMNSGKGLRYVGLGCGLVPFVINYTTTSSSSVDGAVTSMVVRNWTAIAGGGVGLLIGLLLIPLALRAGSERNRALGWAGGVIALALYQLVVRSGLVF